MVHGHMHMGRPAAAGRMDTDGMGMRRRRGWNAERPADVPPGAIAI